MSLPALSALMFKKKVKAGVYVTEEVSCFCGSGLHRVVTNKDRYNFDHNMCLCEECGLLYANPRMTKESYDDFYENHYRDIYGKGQGHYTYGGTTHTFELTKKFILSILEDHEMPEPKAIFEIGCGEGDALGLFSCETYGVDLDSNSIERGRIKGHNVNHGSISTLELLGKKADLIILNHVVEHFLDLRKELLRVRNLLSENGVIYLAVPGLYCWDRGSIFQNAHTYQFTANSLEYVMRACGFDELHLNDNIESIWLKGPFINSKPIGESESIVKYLTCTDSKKFVPRVRVSSKFSMKERRKNIECAIKSGVAPISEIKETHLDSEAIIIGGGPTTDKYINKIKSLQKKGARIFCIERMYQWCLNHGITPEYVIAMDASDDVLESFESLSDGSVFILMAQCKPEVFDRLKNEKTYYFLVPQKGIDIKKYIKKDELKKVTWINPAGSVTLGALAIAITIGARYFHMFGFDCHVGKGNYAKGITGIGCVRDTMEIDVNNRTFITTPAYLAFMQHFFGLYKVAKDLNQLRDIKIYGDSMVKAAAKIDLDGDK